MGIKCWVETEGGREYCVKSGCGRVENGFSNL